MRRRRVDSKFAMHVTDPSGEGCAFECYDACALSDSVDTGGHYSIYVIAIDVYGIAEAGFGLWSEGSFLFYGWTGCGDAECPTAGRPGHGEGVTIVWSSEQEAFHVTLGVLDVDLFLDKSIQQA